MKSYLITPAICRAFATAFALLAAFHSRAAQSELALGTASAYPGTTVSVPVRLADATDAVAAQLDVRFDPARAALEPVAPSAVQGRIVRSRRLASGVQRILVYSLNNSRLPGETTLAVQPVTLKSYSGSGPLSLANAIVAEADSTVVAPLSLRDGAVEANTVQWTADGSVRFYLPAEAGASYRIQASTNLTDWLDLSTERAEADFLEGMDADARLYPHRFYRWASLIEIAGGATGSPTLALTSSDLAPVALRIPDSQSYTVQMSFDLRNWVDVQPKALPGGGLDVSSLASTNGPAAFFRLRRNASSGR